MKSQICALLLAAIANAEVNHSSITKNLRVSS